MIIVNKIVDHPELIYKEIPGLDSCGAASMNIILYQIKTRDLSKLMYLLCWSNLSGTFLGHLVFDILSSDLIIHALIQIYRKYTISATRLW